jgi:hypothetical protein
MLRDAFTQVRRPALALSQQQPSCGDTPHIVREIPLKHLAARDQEICRHLAGYQSLCWFLGTGPLPCDASPQDAIQLCAVTASVLT